MSTVSTVLVLVVVPPPKTTLNQTKEKHSSTAKGVIKKCIRISIILGAEVVIMFYRRTVQFLSPTSQRDFDSVGGEE